MNEPQTYGVLKEQDERKSVGRIHPERLYHF